METKFQSLNLQHMCLKGRFFCARKLLHFFSLSTKRLRWHYALFLHNLFNAMEHKVNTRLLACRQRNGNLNSKILLSGAQTCSPTTATTTTTMKQQARSCCISFSCLIGSYPCWWVLGSHSRQEIDSLQGVKKPTIAKGKRRKKQHQIRKIFR